VNCGIDIVDVVGFVVGEVEVEVAQEPQVVVVELGSDHDSQVGSAVAVDRGVLILVCPHAARPVDFAEPPPQVYAEPPTEMVPATLPSPPIGGASTEDAAQPVVRGPEGVVVEGRYVTGSELQADQAPDEVS
jgi:hypothetical protein